MEGTTYAELKRKIKNPNGRYSKLNKRMIRVLVNYVREGIPQKIAAGTSGLSYQTFNDWMVKGAQEVGLDDYDLSKQTLYAELYNAIETATFAYKSSLHLKEHEHIFELNNPQVLMNAMKCRLPETHNPTNYQQTDLHIDAAEHDPDELIELIKQNVGHASE